MPSMTIDDFGAKVPNNAADIVQWINNQILFHAESTFWKSNPTKQNAYETDLIRRYLSGDRTGDLSHAPDPIYP